MHVRVNIYVAYILQYKMHISIYANVIFLMTCFFPLIGTYVGSNPFSTSTPSPSLPEIAKSLIWPLDDNTVVSSRIPRGPPPDRNSSQGQAKDALHV